MKTTHELAKELMELPDMEIVVEGWISHRGYEIAAVRSGFDPERVAILVQIPEQKKIEC